MTKRACVDNDDRAVHVLEACHDAGLAIPQDVAVIGVDNDEVLCTHTRPPLTSIQPDHEQIGQLAAEQLGFPKLSRLREAFRRQFGTTMADYRLKGHSNSAT